MNPFKVVAITGSVGKTTTRQIVHHVLSRRFRTHQAQKSFNNNIGLPLTLLGAGPQDEVIIAELGANHPGEIADLTRIAQPDIAVVTNAHPAHLEGFGDLATIIREKLSIADGLSDGGVFIINGDIEPLVAAVELWAWSVARASRPCVSPASCRRFEGETPSSGKSKGKMPSPRRVGPSAPSARPRMPAIGRDMTESGSIRCVAGLISANTGSGPATGWHALLRRM